MNSLMEKSVYKIFTQLAQRKSVTDCLCVASLPFSDRHKIGISADRCPMFFIECSSTKPSLDVNLEFVSVNFNCKCQLFQDDENQGVTIENTYTIIQLKSDNADFQQYFVEIVALALDTLPELPTHGQLKIEIQKLIDLFSRFNKPPRQTVQGLWAELFIIEQAKYPEYLIRAWHSSPEDKFDFNDGQDKIEVKSTAQSRRVHSFAAEQLNPNRNANLIIASMFVINTGIGKNIFDLIDSICQKVINPVLQYRLNEIIGQTIGSDFEKISCMYYDYQQAIDTLQFYDFKNIPTIKMTDIPEDVHDVHFNCDLSNIPPISQREFAKTESQLFKSTQR